MKALLEIHILQNFAPSNLNRDDTGSPKDAFFGGVRRGRISSQSLKRSERIYFKEQALLPDENLAMRTKRLTSELVRLLEEQGHPNNLAIKVVNLALGGLKIKVDEEKGKTEYLIYFGNQEIAVLADLIHVNWGKLAEALEKEDSGKKKDKKAAKDAVDKDIIAALEKVLDGGKAVDLALFGRMLADLPEKNQYAACQVAHAISTHKIDRSEDFYTAVDDLKPDDNAGADMLGTVEFNSACYYRYAVIDLEKLRYNLGGTDKVLGDSELALKGVEAFLRASIYALPTGKQNSFAAHQLPNFIGFTVREQASPRSLANAFEKPVKPKEAGLTTPSIEALETEWERLERIYGQPGESSVISNDLSVLGKFLKEKAVGNVEELISKTLERIKAAMGW
jgi:CRISPR system Cascade subunit CasC